MVVNHLLPVKRVQNGGVVPKVSLIKPEYRNTKSFKSTAYVILETYFNFGICIQICPLIKNELVNCERCIQILCSTSENGLTQKQTVKDFVS